MSASETAYGEADRAWELETALQIAPTVPRADEIWSLDLRDAGESHDASSNVMVATIAPQGLSNVPVGFESLVGDTQNLQDRLFALLCRAIAFPMSKRNSARPWKIVVSRKDLLDPAVVEKKLGIVVEVSGSETSSAAAPDLRDYACHQCGNMMFRVFRCGKCRAVNYCGAKCQTDNWSRHKGICKALKLAMDTTDDSASNSAFEIVKTLREGNPSEPPSSTQDSIPASLILSTAKLDSIGLFTSALCSQTFTFTDRLALLDIKLDATAGFPEQLIQPSSSLLNSKGGFAETPAAILSWEDYLAACSISKPCNNPFPLLISYPLTIWHILSHVLPDMERFYAGEPLNRNKVALKNGAHVVVHIVMAEQWQVELAPLFEFLVPLIRGATIDFFVIGPELIVKPMATAGTDAEPAARDERIERTEEVADKTAPQRSLLRKAEHSIEFKSERYASCIRVHVARSTCSYPPQQGSFPIDSYPPDVVLSFGTSGKDSSPSTELRSSLRAANLPGRFVICVDSNLVSALESLQDTEAKRPKGHRAGRVWGPESNPFRQPWKRRRFDSDLPGFGNGLIWGWAC